MKKGTVLVLLMSMLTLGAVAQAKSGIDFMVGRGTTGMTLLNRDVEPVFVGMGLNIALDKTYVIKGSFGLDNFKNPGDPGVSVRHTGSLGFGAMVTKEVELHSSLALSTDRDNRHFEARYWGAILGGKYHTPIGVTLGAQYNTTPVYMTNNAAYGGRKYSKPAAVFSLGFNL